jgi:hypothetical protein
MACYGDSYIFYFFTYLRDTVYISAYVCGYTYIYIFIYIYIYIYIISIRVWIYIYIMNDKT